MTTLVLRNEKLAELTWSELDANFSNLNADKLEKSNNLSELTDTVLARSNLGLGTLAVSSATLPVAVTPSLTPFTTIFGAGSGPGVTGVNNTIIGHLAGVQLISGIQNTILGKAAGSSGANNLITGSNNILIGFNAEPSSSSTSNETTIGNVSTINARIFGTLILKSSLFEQVTVLAQAPTSTVNFDAQTQSILVYTTAATANWTLNIRGSSAATLNSILPIGDSLSVSFLVTNASVPYWQTAITIDGIAVTPQWQGAVTPSTGNANSTDMYSITVIKTAASTYRVLAAQTRFA